MAVAIRQQHHKETVMKKNAIHSIHSTSNQQLTSIRPGEQPVSVHHNHVSDTTRDAVIPTVIEDMGGRERAFDIYSRLLKSNIIMLTGEINDDIASLIKAQMLFLGDADQKNPVKLYIDSPGGSVTAGLGILDVMQTIPNKVITICSGQCASMAAVILSCGDERLIYPNARVLIHQPLGGAQGQATDITIQANEINRMKALLYEIMAKKANHSPEKIRQDCERDYIMDAAAAIAYGMVDRLVPSIKEGSKKDSK
jgi:ATP-dependent Clp protease protease subunit